MSSFLAEFPLNNPDSQQTDWGRILESHQRWLSTIVRARLADPHAAADVLQDVALAAISQPNRPSEPDKIAPWLYRITLRKIVNHHRTTGRRKRLIESVANHTHPQPQSDSQEPGSWLLQKENQNSVQQGLAKLSPQDRQLLLLKYTEGWGYEQLSEHLGVSIKTIEYRLLKARRALRAQLASDS
jgi:RNA polymerase sigma-70 factor (ECF subfamily)